VTVTAMSNETVRYDLKRLAGPWLVSKTERAEKAAHVLPISVR
jgi:hypothetical protein